MPDKALAFDQLASGAAQTLRSLLAAQQQRQVEEIRALAALKKMLQEQAFEAQQNALDRQLKYNLAKMSDETKRELAAKEQEIDLMKLKEQRRRNQMLDKLRKEQQDWRNKNMQYQRALDAIDLLLESKKAGLRNVGGLLTPEQLVGEGGAPTQAMPQLDDVTAYTRYVLQNILQEAGLPGLPVTEPQNQQQLPPGAIPFSVYDPRTMQLIINRNKAKQNIQQQNQQKTKPKQKKDDIDKEIEALGGIIID